MKPSERPRPTGKPHSTVVLTGMVIPWMQNEPAYVAIANGEDDPLIAMAVFTTADVLRAAMHDLEIPYVRVKQIDDHSEFLQSVPSFLKLILDPHRSDRGTVIYTEVFRD